MGASWSSTPAPTADSSAIPVKGAPISNNSKLESAFLIVDDSFTDASQKSAYEKGVADANANFQSTLEALAAQVYDNVENDLKQIQEESIKKSKITVDYLNQQINKNSFTQKNACSTESSELLKCIEQNTSSSIKCKELVDKFSNCALNF